MTVEQLKEPTFSTLLSLDYGKSSGSGFKLNYNNHTFLVTAKHVIYDEDNKLRCKKLVITSQKIRGIDIDSKILDVNMTKAKVSFCPMNDVAIILLEKDGVLEQYIELEQKGTFKTLFIESEIIKKEEDLNVSENVFLIGFPTSLIFQETKYFDISRPLLRKGIIAGINQAENTFIIDCPSYYGNSGSPIIQIEEDNKISLIGLISKYIPFMTTWGNNRENSITRTEFSNSGYSVCIPTEPIINLIENFIKNIAA